MFRGGLARGGENTQTFGSGNERPPTPRSRNGTVGRGSVAPETQLPRSPGVSPRNIPPSALGTALAVCPGMSRSFLRPALALVLLFAQALPAAACWDGYAAVYKDLVLQGGDTEWSPETARKLALWMPRIQALVADEGAEIYMGSAYIRDRELSYPEGDFEALFAVLVDELDIDAAGRRAAMGEGNTALTVQVAATRNRARAEALVHRLLHEHPAAQLDADPELLSLFDPHGFYEAGGFPADNSAMHIMERLDDDGTTVYQVVVGAFMERSAADEVLQEVRRTYGIDGFVRRL